MDAPFHHTVAEGPETARAEWATTPDGLRLRLAIWPADGTAKGTILLFPGRTEYVEKYGQAAGELTAAGYAVISVDWRGQGLSDRLLNTRLTGHVKHFDDYQVDVAELLKSAKAHSLPQPYYLLGHSMGGCIGLRALMNGLPVKAAAFTAPMWGILMPAYQRPFAWALSWASRYLGFDKMLVPGTTRETYVKAAPFDDNSLTTDPEIYAYMQRQVAAHPELALGGPSLRWLYEALIECRRMARIPAPAIPTLTFLGSNERIVTTAPIHKRMNGWANGRLQMVPKAEHEVMMETPAIRTQAFAEIIAHFDAQSDASIAWRTEFYRNHTAYADAIIDSAPTETDQQPLITAYAHLDRLTADLTTKSPDEPDQNLHKEKDAALARIKIARNAVSRQFIKLGGDLKILVAAAQLEQNPSPIVFPPLSAT